MNNTGLIISREYTTRVKKKSFILLTLLVPILMALLIALPAILLLHSEENQHSTVLVVDETEIFLNAFENDKNTTYLYQTGDIETLKKQALDDNVDAVFHIIPSAQAMNANLYYKDNLPSMLTATLESQMNNIFFDKILQDTFHIDPVKFEQIQELTQAHISTIQMDDSGNERENIAEINQIVGMVFGLTIYFVIIFFASQVLRGVLEEKTNRIVEVLISSVKPMQLLVGKIIGIALVGLTQLLIWIVVTVFLILIIQLFAPVSMTDPTTMADMTAAGENMNIFNVINNYFSVSFTQLILCFLFFFITGYLMYATLYAATGSVVDNESDSQQYTMPVTIPLLLAIIFVPVISNNPNGQLAIWTSIIPLTSPICMMARLPAGVPLWQLLLSMGLMIGFVIFCMWAAAKIYRVGILMYGKKSSWKEIFKWIKK